MADGAPRAFLLRGIVAGAAAGAFAGLLDASRALGSPNDLIQASDALVVCGFYAAWFTPAGLAAALLVRRAEWPSRLLNLLVAGGAGWFFTVAWANMSFLPGFTSGLALAFDLVTAVVVAALVRARYRSPGEDATHTRRWVVLGLASAGIAAAMPVAVPARDDGRAPAATAARGVPRPNVLVCLVDTLRADHLGCYGYTKPTSPELDAFAADATRFEDCRAATSWTKPSTASLLTSMAPSTHACIEHREVLVPDAETMAEVFRAAGWRTAAFVDNPFVSREFGFAQGFDVYDEVRPSVVLQGTLLGKALLMARVTALVGRPFGADARDERGAAELHRRLLEFIDGTKEPWFAYVHAMEPHLPYEPARADAEAMGFPAGGEPYVKPPSYEGILPFQTTPKPAPDFLTKIVAQYDGEIRGWSRAFGSLIEGLRARGRLDDTIVVVLADHGEEFHEHGGWRHGHSLHREVVHVPLIVRVPEIVGAAARASRGRAVEGTATLLDVFPTLRELAGIRYPAGDEPSRIGESLAAQIVGTGATGGASGAGGTARPPSDRIPDTRPILAELTVSPVRIRSIRDGRWLLLRAEQPMETSRRLYDDVGDPSQKHDRWEPRNAETEALEARLDAFFDRLSRIALTGRERTIDAETAEHLRKLGYTGGR